MYWSRPLACFCTIYKLPSCDSFQKPLPKRTLIISQDFGLSLPNVGRRSNRRGIGSGPGSSIKKNRKKIECFAQGSTIKSHLKIHHPHFSARHAPLLPIWVVSLAGDMQCRLRPAATYSIMQTDKDLELLALSPPLHLEIEIWDPSHFSVVL